MVTTGVTNSNVCYMYPFFKTKLILTNKKFTIIRLVGADLFHSDGRTDTRTDMTELIFALGLHILVLSLNTKDSCNQLTKHYIPTNKATCFG